MSPQKSRLKSEVHPVPSPTEERFLRTGNAAGPIAVPPEVQNPDENGNASTDLANDEDKRDRMTLEEMREDVKPPMTAQESEELLSAKKKKIDKEIFGKYGVNITVLAGKLCGSSLSEQNDTRDIGYFGGNVEKDVALISKMLPFHSNDAEENLPFILDQVAISKNMAYSGLRRQLVNDPHFMTETVPAELARVSEEARSDSTKTLAQVHELHEQITELIDQAMAKKIETGEIPNPYEIEKVEKALIETVLQPSITTFGTITIDKDREPRWWKPLSQGFKDELLKNLVVIR